MLHVRSIALIATLLGALLAAAPAAADDATCSYTGATRTVSVVITPNANSVPTLDRDAAGNIRVLDAEAGLVPCGGTVSDTDTIVITNASTTVPVNVFYVNFKLPLAPGFTDEPGSSDEIELAVDFGPAGGRVGLDVTYSTSDPGVSMNIAMGGNVVNLNASEADGVDADLTLSNVTSLIIYGSHFNDSIVGSGGTGTPAVPFQLPFEASADLGDDLIVGGDGNDGRLIGDDGNDTIFGGNGNDTIWPGDGDDVVDAGAGDDLVTDLVGPSGSVPTNGDDRILGGPGNDTVHALDGADVILGGPGNDTIWPGLGDDRAVGGPGRDRLRESDGDDVAVGGGGKDWVEGGAGRDRLRGGGGPDRLMGGTGNDRLHGGPSRDRCDGGPGNDQFVSCEVTTP